MSGGNLLSRFGNFMYSHPLGLTLDAVLSGATEPISKSLKPQSLLKGKYKPPVVGMGLPFNQKLGRYDMPKNLKDFLVEKIKKANTEKTAGVDSDVAFVNEITKPFTGNRENVKVAGMTELFSSDAAKAGVNALNLLGLGYLGGTAIGNIYDKVNDAVKKQKAYTQMFEEFPNLNELPREQVDKYWTVLNDFAPKLTTNPLVAGQFIENMATYGFRGIDHNVVGQLAQISNALNQSSGAADAMKALSTLGTKAFEVDTRGMGVMEGIDGKPPTGMGGN